MTKTRKICRENEDVSEVNSEQAIPGSQRERKDTQGKGKRGSYEHESNTSHSNSRDTDYSNSDVPEEEMKLLGNLEALLKIRAVIKVLIRRFLRAILPVAVVFYSFSESSQLILLYSSWL